MKCRLLLACALFFSGCKSHDDWREPRIVDIQVGEVTTQATVYTRNSGFTIRRRSPSFSVSNAAEPIEASNVYGVQFLGSYPEVESSFEQELNHPAIALNQAEGIITGTACVENNRIKIHILPTSRLQGITLRNVKILPRYYATRSNLRHFRITEDWPDDQIWGIFETTFEEIDGERFIVPHIYLSLHQVTNTSNVNDLWPSNWPIDLVVVESCEYLDHAP